MRSARGPSPANAGGFTLIELLVVVALVAVVIALAAPSLNKMIVMQRLRGVSTQLTTDLQFARSEAVSRQDVVGISFKSTVSGQSCYVVHSCGQPTAADLLAAACTCDCLAAAGSRCTAPRIEIRTVDIPRTSGVLVKPSPVSPALVTPDTLTFDPATGAMSAFFTPSIFFATPPPASQFWVDTTLTSAVTTTGLRTKLSSVGRPSTCALGPVSAVTPCV